MQDWLGYEGGGALHEDDELIVSVTDFLERFGKSRFQYWKADERAHGPIDRAGYVKTTAASACFYVFPRVFKDAICKGYEPTRARSASRSPLQYAVSVPARQAYSHSSSIGRRAPRAHSWFEDSQRQNAMTSSHATLTTGCPG